MDQNAQCRICTSTDVGMSVVDIFEQYDGQECVANILLELAGIKATHDDGFPNNCCTQCHAELISAVSVRRKCIDSNKFFQSAIDCAFPFTDDQVDDVSMMSSKYELVPSFHCSECTIDFYSVELLQEHYQTQHANTIHGWKSFGISEISQFDTTDEEEDDIVATNSEAKDTDSPHETHRCCGCLLAFDTALELRQHADTVHASNVMQIDESRAFRCSVCYRVFTNAHALENHQNNEYLSRFQCVTCGMLFGQLAQLTRHEFKHTWGKFTCDICGKIYSHPDSLNCHKKRVHANAQTSKSQQKHICNHCGKSVSSAAYLKTHMRLHSNEEPFSCNLCGARFKLYTYLKWHMSVHTGAHKCKECDASFKSPSELQDHMNKHMGSREFSCTFCGSNFYTKRSLFKHMRSVHAHYQRKQV